MITKLISTVLFLVVFHFCFSQNCHWAKVTNEESGFVGGSQVFSSEIFEGFLYTCGTFRGITNIGLPSNPYFIENSDQITDGGLYISKSDLNGNIIQSVVFDEISGDFGLSSMTVDSIGNIYLGTTCWGQIDADPTNVTEILGPISTNSRFAMYMKLDENFNVVWKETLGTTDAIPNSNHFEVNQVVTDINSSMYVIGHYLIAPASYDFDPSSGVFLLNTSSNYRSPYIIRLDSLGVFQWAYHLNTYDVTIGLDIAVDSDGMVYSTGYINSNVDFDNSIDTTYLQNYVFGSRAYLLKIDNNGLFNWVVGNSSTSVSYGYTVATTLENEIVIGGQYQGDGYFFGTNGDTLNMTSPTPGTAAGFLVEYDSLGNLLFANSYGEGGIFLVKTHQDSITASGFMNDNFTVQTDLGPIIIDLDYDAGPVVLILNNIGQYVDHLQIRATGGSVHVNAINFDESSYIYLSGTYQDSIYFSSTFQSYEFGTVGNIDGFQAKYDFSQNYALLNSLDVEGRVHLYPNPTNGNVSFNDGNLNATHAEVVDLLGTRHFYKVESGLISMKLSNGIYLMKIFNDEKYLGCSSFFIEND